MKIYILTSYDTGLNDPLVYFSYEDAYHKMERSFHTALESITQTVDEKENTSLDAFSATAVISGDWIEWAITEVELPLSSFEAKKNNYSEGFEHDRFRTGHLE